MAHYPQSSSGLQTQTFPAGPTAQPTQVTSGGANTKGTYTELVSSAPFDCNAIIVTVTRTTAIVARFLLDLALGASSSEVNFVTNLVFGNDEGATSHTAGVTFRIPASIPSGSRISARTQCSQATQNTFMAITLVAAGDTPGIDTFTPYGANTGTSGGVAVDPGGTINTKGSVAEIAASTSEVTQWLMAVVTLGGNTLPAAAQWSMDILTGPGGSETVLINDLRFSTPAAGASGPRTRVYEFLTYIPAGTRLSARASCDINDATDRVFQIGLLAAPAPVEGGGSPSPGEGGGGVSRSRIQRHM